LILLLTMRVTVGMQTQYTIWNTQHKRIKAECRMRTTHTIQVGNGG